LYKQKNKRKAYAPKGGGVIAPVNPPLIIERKHVLLLKNCKICSVGIPCCLLKKFWPPPNLPSGSVPDPPIPNIF